MKSDHVPRKTFGLCDFGPRDLPMMSVRELCEAYYRIRERYYGPDTSAPNAIIAELERRIAGDA